MLRVSAQCKGQDENVDSNNLVVVMMIIPMMMSLAHHWRCVQHGGLKAGGRSSV